MTLILAEKPSVARDITKALGRRGESFKSRSGFLLGTSHVVSWAVGHLLELCEPQDYNPSLKRWTLDSLPIMPERFRLKPTRGGRTQLNVVSALLVSPAFREVVNACDAGREGELIFRHLMEVSESPLPVRRMWVSAMTTEAILEGLDETRDGADFWLLETAARCRNESDWLVGINATRGMTKKCGGVLLSVGRVQTPTLAILAERERDIQAFTPETYWEVWATFEAAGKATDGESYRGRWFSAEAKDGRLRDLARATSVVETVRDRSGHVVSVETKRKRQAPPLLYDLTQLQRDMNRRHGFTATRTLSLAQDLYEKFKVITYPRTDSRFLSGKNIPLLLPTLRGVAKVSPELAVAAGPFLTQGRLPVTGRQVNDARVRDHHAIIPTVKAAAGASLKGDHRKVFEAVSRRFIAAFYPAAVYDDTTVITGAVGETFRSKGRTIVDQGWLAVEEAGWLPGADDDDADLPHLSEGVEVRVDEVAAAEKQTRPPVRYTEASLLQAMETAGKLVDDEELQEAMKERGIGTPATRAAIIERLVDVGYVERDRRSLVVTPKGLELVAAIPTRDLVSPALTGAWEARLGEVETGALGREAFMSDIRDFVGRMVDEVKAMDTAGLAARMQRTVGACPLCGREVIEGPRAYYCSAYKDKACGFYIWKTIAGRQLRPLEASKLLAQGKTGLLRGFRSRAGRRFPAYLTLEASGEVKFVFPERKSGSRSGRRPRKTTGSKKKEVEGSPV